MAFHNPLTHAIPPFRFFAVMTDAVYFNRQFQFFAIEIHNVIDDRPLPVKIISKNLFPPETTPQKPLGLCHPPAKLASFFLQVRTVRYDVTSCHLRYPTPT